MKGRRRRLFIHKIFTENDNWVRGMKTLLLLLVVTFKTYLLVLIVELMMSFCTAFLYCLVRNRIKFSKLCLIWKSLIRLFSLESNSAAGPDEIIGKFFQVYWDVIKNDLLDATQSFLCG